MAHLTRSQRDQLAVLHRLGKSQTEIASLIGCSQPTVSRELKRFPHPRLWYDAETAHRLASERRTTAKEKSEKWHDDPRVLRYVIEHLRRRESPEQIAGRMTRESPWHRAHAVSAKSLYTYIWQVKEAGGCLHHHLRRRGKRTRWFGFQKVKKQTIPHRRDISERPAIVEKRIRCGDWESDLIVGGSAVATFVERFSKYLRAVVVADQGAEEFVRASQVAFAPLPATVRLTMTHDNGKEISRHEIITKELGLLVYCARPYHSWERGLNENTNGLIRDFFPKGTDFRTVSQEDLDQVVHLLNNRPRRSLHYRTPQEVLDAEIKGYAFQSSE